MSTIKVVFNEEVRRVQVAGAVSAASYLKLEETIKNLFPVLRDTHFVLVWQDDEGDKVSVSSGSEFFEALHVMSYARGVPRFTVKPTTEKSQVVHSSVTCDECGVSPIRGDRFKCTVRNDFDLCKGCEARRTQPYPMIKIANSAPLYRVSPFGCRAAQRGQIRECVRGPQPQFQAVGLNPLGFPLHGRHPVGISFVEPPQQLPRQHQQQRARQCVFSPCNRPAPNTLSATSKDSEEVQLEAEVLSFLQAIGAVPRHAAPQQTSQHNTSSVQSAPSTASSAAPEKKESAAAQDRLESELTSLLQAIFSGQQPFANNSNAAPNSNSSSNSSSSDTVSQPTRDSHHGATRDLNDEDEALQRAIRESLRVAAEGADKQQQREKQHDQEEEEDVEDVWSESDSVSSGDFQVVGSSSSVADQSAPIAEPESVPVAQPVATGPTEDELLSLWSRELAVLASMGFSDPLVLLPLLQTHVGLPASASSSSSGSSSSSSSDGAASAHHPEGLQRVVGELIRGKF